MRTAASTQVPLPPPNPPPQQQQLAAAVSKQPAAGGKARDKEKKPGYCELCESNFDKLQAHLEDERHRARVRSQDIWSELDASLRLANKVYAGSHAFVDCD